MIWLNVQIFKYAHFCYILIKIVLKEIKFMARALKDPELDSSCPLATEEKLI